MSNPDLGPLLALTISLSSSSCLSTSPMICPTDCNAFKSSSLLSNSFLTCMSPVLSALTLAVLSLCSSSFLLYSLTAASRCADDADPLTSILLLLLLLRSLSLPRRDDRTLNLTDTKSSKT